MKRGTVLCAGRLYADLVFTDMPRMPTAGTETFAGGAALHAGGGAFVTAAWLSALGREARLAAVLPAEPFGAAVAAEVARAGVVPAPLAPAPDGADPQVTAAMAVGGDRAFVTRRAGPAVPAVDLAAPGLAHLHVGELATMAEAPDLLRDARAAGLTVSLDCAWDDGLTAAAAALVRDVDLFLPNAVEAARLATLGVAPGQGRALWVVKRGADGAVAHAPAGALHRPAHAAGVVDATGAGDAFDAGFLDLWLEGAPLADCLDGGAACGARAVTRPGGATAALELRGARCRHEAAPGR